VASRFKINIPGEPCTLSVGDNIQDKKTWVDCITVAILSSDKINQNRFISCEIFGAVSGDTCASCGVAKLSHFQSTASSLGISPIDNHKLEGNLHIHKKKNKIAFGNDWKKR
jgi:hypothetical protein